MPPAILKLAAYSSTSNAGGVTAVYGELRNTNAASYGVWGTTLNNTNVNAAWERMTPAEKAKMMENVKK